MREATGPLPAVSGLGQVIAVSERVLAELRATQELLRRDLAVRGPLDDLAQLEFRLAAMEAVYSRGIEGAVFQAVDPALSAPHLAVVPDAPPARHRHRQRRVPRPRDPADRPLWPRLVQVIVPAAAAAWGALKLAARHAWAVHPAATAAGVTTGGVAVVALTAHLVTMTPASPRPGAYAGPVPSAPAAGAWAASPITSSPAPGPSASRSAGADARAAGLAGIVPLAPWSPSPSPSLSPSPVLTPAPVTGTLSADVAAADLSSGQQVTITLTASGAPVGWGAWCDDKADVLLSATSGTARPGFPSYLTLSLAPQPDEATATTCHIWPGGFRITVTLPGPLVPSTAPAPSDTPSPDPSSS